MTDVTMRVTEVTVSALPEDHPDMGMWSVRVAWRGGWNYAVVHHGAVLNDQGEWECEPIPSARDDAFVRRTRFNYNRAVDLACEHASRISLNGLTAADVLAREATP